MGKGPLEEPCLFDILALPEATLLRVLPTVSTRMLVRLAAAFPRAAGRPFMDILSQALSQPTMDFLREEINQRQTPSIPEIRQAEAELAKALREQIEHPVDDHARYRYV
jgi:hypothetical protein